MPLGLILLCTVEQPLPLPVFPDCWETGDASTELSRLPQRWPGWRFAAGPGGQQEKAFALGCCTPSGESPVVPSSSLVRDRSRRVARRAVSLTSAGQANRRDRSPNGRHRQCAATASAQAGGTGNTARRISHGWMGDTARLASQRRATRRNGSPTDGRWATRRDRSPTDGRWAARPGWSPTEGRHGAPSGPQ